MPVKKGGNKAKKAKKVTVEISRILEFKEDGQEYGQITKTLGGARFEINCFDKKQRLGHSRGALKKKKVFVKMGDIVLVSLRDYQDEKCDILMVYNPKEVKELIKLAEISPTAIVSFEVSDHKDEDIGVEFEEEIIEEEKPDRDDIIDFDLI